MMLRMKVLALSGAFALLTLGAWADCGKCGGTDKDSQASCAAAKADKDGATASACSAKACTAADKEGKAACCTKGADGKVSCKNADGKACVCKGADKEGKACCAKSADGKSACKAGDGAKCAAAKGEMKQGAKCEMTGEKKGEMKGGCCAMSAGTGMKSEIKSAASSASSASEAAAGAPAKAYAVDSKVADFSLPEAKSGKEVKLSEVAGEKATVLVFWNQNCPYVREAAPRVADLAKAYADKGVKVVALDAGVNNSAGDIKTYAEGQPFTVLVNSDSRVASWFGATRTPETFVLDKDRKVIYHGAFDSGKSKTESGAREDYAKNVVDAALAGKPHTTTSRAFGCSIKYAEGVKPLASE